MNGRPLSKSFCCSAALAALLSLWPLSETSAQDRSPPEHLAGSRISARKPPAQLFASDCTGAGCHKGPQGLGRGHFRAASRTSCASITPTAVKAPRRWPAIFRISRGARPLEPPARRGREACGHGECAHVSPCRIGARVPNRSRHRAKCARRARSPVAGPLAPLRGLTRIPRHPAGSAGRRAASG